LDAETIDEDGAPTARVGHAAATVGQDVLLFGGRGGVDIKALDEEQGRVWIFSGKNRKWSHVDPPSGTSFPEARSYHSAAGSKDTFYVHAGCPASGRASDLWSFGFVDKTWKELASAPSPPRGGPGFVYALGKLWRYGGFDGKQELGGKLDFLDVSDANAKWETVSFEDDSCPGGRSVTGLQSCTVDSRDFLVAFFGEKDASSKGHDGAGMFWDDVWSIEIKEGRPADAWQQCQISDTSDKPTGRGWFASDRSDADSIVIYGGLNGRNERESDGYVLKLALRGRDWYVE